MSLVGRLEDLALSDIFQILSIGKKTGALLITGSAGVAMIVFRNGLVIKAENSALGGSLGKDLLDSGHIKDSALQMAIEVKKKLPNKSTAEILFDLGAVSREVIERSAKKRIEQVVCQLLMWESGDFQFEPEELYVKDKRIMDDTGWEVAKGISPEYLLMEGARTYDETYQHEIVSEREIFGEAADEADSSEEDWSSAHTQERKDISALKSLTQELRFPNSISEITLLILRFASDIFQRGVLFMVNKDEIVGLGQFGIDIEQADEKVRGMRFALDKSGFFKKIVESNYFYKGSMERDDVTELMIGEFGGGWPSEVGVFPVTAEGKTSALLYCDNLPAGDAIGATEGLEIFISQAGMALEKSLLQRRLQEMQNNMGNKK